MIVRLAPRAARDLADIRYYLDEIGSPHGAAVVDRLFAGFEKLTTMPERGLIQRTAKGREIRRILVDKHIVLYELAGERLDILRVVHAHRDIRDIFRLEVG